MNINEVIDRYSRESVGLSLRLLVDDDIDGSTNAATFVVVEGSSRTFRMLGELFLSFADQVEWGDFSIGPHSAGSFHFAPDSELGIYLNRLPEP